MVCPFCGTTADLSSGFCPACRRAVSAEPDPTGVDATTIPPPADAGTSLPPLPAAAPEGETFLPELRTASSRPWGSGSGPFSPGQTLNNRYHIISMLGRGGMGAVYHAWDAELGVAVALKVILLSPDDPVTAAELSRRFKKELLLARLITHRNVVRIHDIGEVNGIKFISMPYIKGEDLATVLQRGAIDVPRVVSLAKQIASGLAAAHEAGVVHRDLKPANIMIEDGEFALLMDFGIARSLRGRTGPGTLAGSVVGTLDYMAPEQARAEAVDHRADIYAFGLILYEMLGARPTAKTDQSMMADLMRRMQQAPKPLREARPEVPEALAAVVMRCLQPAAADRYQTTKELVEALEDLDSAGNPRPERRARPRTLVLAAAATVLVLIGFGVSSFLTRGRVAAPPVQREPVSVLIADFENKANDPVFDGTLENALTVAMEGASFINSFPRNAAQATIAQIRPGKRLDEEGAKLVSQREGIKVILAGAIERDGQGYKVSVRAIDPIPGTTVATATADADNKADVLDAVGRIASRLRRELGDTTTESGALAANETFTAASLEAAQEYSRGQELAQESKHEEAIVHYKLALKHDPDLGRAYSGWANAAALLGRTEEAEPLFKEALARLDRMSERERYRTLGTYYIRVARNPEKAIENYSALVERYPGDTVALNNLAVSYFNALDFAKALEYGKRAVDVFPQYVRARSNLALYAMYGGDFDNARVHAEGALKRNPEIPKPYLAIAMAATATGNIDEAKRVWARAAASGNLGASIAAIGLADLAIYQGRFQEADATLAAGIATDKETKNTAGAAAKLVARAEGAMLNGNVKGAVTYALEALKLRRADAVTVPVARVLLAAGRRAEAAAIAADLGKQLPAQSRAFGKVIGGDIALDAGRTVEAVEAYREALKLADLWLVRYSLGIAYVQARAYAEALSELDACVKRHGEATSVFLDDVPSWRYMAPLRYWHARAQEGVGLKTQALDGYKAFLALRPAAAKDPLALDARQRAGQ